MGQIDFGCGVAGIFDLSEKMGRFFALKTALL